MIITLFIIATLTFFTMKLLPGTPFKNSAKLSDEQISALSAHYGLDEPLPQQYITYIGNLLKGDLGLSFQFSRQTINDIIIERIGPSATLGIEAMIIGVIFGLLLGIAAALKHNTWVDTSSMIVATLGVSIPSFVFAGVLQYVIAVKLEWLPVAFWESPKHHLLPAVALSSVVIATLARYIRTELVEVFEQEYILMAKIKGISKWAIIFRHSVRNALIPVITMMGPLAVGIITGSLVIEQIFAIPGLGEQFVQSILQNDYPMIMGLTMFYSFLFLTMVFIIDLLYGIIDPRIRLAGGKNNVVSN